jgi:hypothetical protein
MGRGKNVEDIFSGVTTLLRIFDLVAMLNSCNNDIPCCLEPIHTKLSLLSSWEVLLIRYTLHTHCCKLPYYV